MKESYGEGLTPHAGPESCGDVRKGVVEALTGESTGRVLSREIHAPPQGGLLLGADAVEEGGRQHWACRQGETCLDLARSETLSTYRSTSNGNREIPRPSATEEVADRIEKSKDARR